MKTPANEFAGACDWEKRVAYSDASVKIIMVSRPVVPTGRLTMATTVMRVVFHVFPIVLLILILIRIGDIPIKIHGGEVVGILAPVKRVSAVAILSVCHIEVLLVHDPRKRGRGE